MARGLFRDYLSTVVTDEEFDNATRESRRLRRPEVPTWLYDYEDQELALSRKICDAQASAELINIRDFFPDLKMESPFCDRLPGVPIWVLLPFYNHIIVWLEPIRSPTAFTRLYGVTPDAFAELCGARPGEGRVIPILNASPPAFHGLRHFDRILAIRPPTVWRDFLFQRALIGGDALGEARREAEAIVPRRLGSGRRFATLRMTRRGSVRDLAISCYCQICAFGGRDLAQRAMIRSRSANAIVDRLFYYSIALYDSFVSPLGGTYPCTHDQFKALVVSASGSRTAPFEAFPVEIGKNLINTLPVPMPITSCSRQWWLTEARTIWQPAREALKALDDALHTASEPALLRDRDRLHDVWTAVGTEMRRSVALKKRAAWAPSAVGVAGAIGSALLPQVPGLVTSLIASAATLSIFDIDAVYAKLFRPRHLVAIVALRDYLHAHPVLGCS